MSHVSIERPMKKVLEIESPFEGDDNALKMYLDVVSSIGSSGGTLGGYHGGNHCPDHVIIIGKDYSNDEFSMFLNGAGTDDISYVRDLIAGKGSITDVSCSKKHCGDLSKGYGLMSEFGDNFSISKINMKVGKDFTKNGAGITLSLYTSRPNHFRNELEELSSKLKETLKKYGANIKTL